MKSFLRLSTFTVVLGVIFNSCTVEKRVHMSGYHIEWNHKTKKIENVANPSFEEDFAQTEASMIVLELDHNVTATASSVVESGLIDLVDGESSNLIVYGGDRKSMSSKEFPVLVDDTRIDEVVSAAPLMTTGEIRNSLRNAKSEIKAFKNAEPGGKSQIVALVLVLLVGALGIHRFYLGYTGIGILMLLTGGLCGILVLIDLIRIITGNLKPVSGDYTEKF
jgi:TM2 domain-containing membrane protein YozV